MVQTFAYIGALAALIASLFSEPLALGETNQDGGRVFAQQRTVIVAPDSHQALVAAETEYDAQNQAANTPQLSVSTNDE